MLASCKVSFNLSYCDLPYTSALSLLYIHDDNLISSNSLFHFEWAYDTTLTPLIFIGSQKKERYVRPGLT